MMRNLYSVWENCARLRAGLGTYSFTRHLLVPLVLLAPVTALGQTTLSPDKGNAAGLALSRTIPVVRRSVVMDDHQVTFVRIQPPKFQPSAPVPQPLPSASALKAEARRAAKAADFASLMATVYPGPVTEISWQSGERSFRAYSNIDFRILDSLSEIETASAVLSWFCIPVPGDDNALPATLRKRLNLSSKNAEYVVDATEEEMEANPEAFAVLDAIHDYFDAHRRELVDAHAKRLAADEARSADLLAHPPVSPDTTVYIWSLNN